MSGSYAFPTAGGDPYSSAPGYTTASSPVQQVQIQPGSITYTTSTLPDGRIQYNQFRAEARSYQTPQGPVHGIQWVPVNVSYELPSNAYPAGPDFHASWSRSGNDKETQRMLKEWGREQEKRARKEEKESAKRMKEWERERREREKAEEKELRRAQERDYQRIGRQRRASDVSYGADYTAYAAVNAPSYTRARSRSRVRRDSTGQDELTRAMAEMAMENDWTGSEADSRWGRERERRNSNVGRRLSVTERPRRLSTSEYERPRKTSGVAYPTTGTGTYPTYGAPPSPGRSSYSGRRSPYIGGGGLPSSGSNVPVYPPGHIYAGKPIPGMQGDSLGGVVSSYRAPSPRQSSRSIESPPGFSRPPSLAVPYTYFEPIAILPDMSDIYQQLPPMPAALAPHDVWLEDWVRCLTDIARTWVGKMPETSMSTRKPSKAVSQLIDVWNAYFFSLRGVELVLFRGRQRRSGPHTGRYDGLLGIEASSDESDTISSVSSESDIDDRYGFYGGAKARYGAGGSSWLTDSREARRARKAEKRLHEKQKRKRREREREKEGRSGFSLFLICTSDGQPPHMAQAAGYPQVPSGY